MAGSASNSERLVSEQRKWEILGVILVTLGALLALALLTYSPEDARIAERFSWGRALDPSGTQTQNALGLIGAALSEVLIPHFLGYPILIVAGLLAFWGYRIFRAQSIGTLPWISAVLALSTVLVSTSIGWFGVILQEDLARFTGSWGAGIAAWLTGLLGATGSAILLVAGLAICLLLLVDHDVQRSLDRLERALASIGPWFRSKWSNWRERRRAKKEEKAEKRRAATRSDGDADAREDRSENRRTGDQEASESSEGERRTPSDEPAPPGTDTSDGDTANASEDEPAVTIEPTRESAREHPSESGSESGGPPSEFDRDPSNGTNRRSGQSAQETGSDAPSSGGEGPSSPSATEETDEKREGEPEMHVREQVQEEKADLDERDADEQPPEVDYEFPSVDLLEASSEEEQEIDIDELERNKRILLDKLETYDIEITDIEVVVGPTVTLYELTPASGVRVSRVTALEDDLAMALAADGIRMIAPIPGKSAIGVEIPNRDRELVRIRSVLNTSRFRDADMELPVALGKTVEGEVFVRDLARMPHLLIAGATGSGKSVGINSLITGLLYACHPRDLKFVLVDPKKIELQQFENLYNHYLATPEDAENPIITDFEEALGMLKSCEREMEHRYDLLSEAGVRSIAAYNEKLRSGELATEEGEHHNLPYVVVIIDELADLMMTSGKEVEGPIARLAQMARAVGIHLVLATQRPSVDVITGLIKANFPSRIAYQVASNADSRTILDRKGAEQLVGNGDLLYMNGSQMVRLQGPFVSVDEVEKVTTFIGRQTGFGFYELPPMDENADGLGATLLPDSETDELFEKAARIIVRHQQGSVSLLQRKMAVGYTRAARIVDQLEEANIVGEFQGSKARDVLVETEEQLDRLLSEEDETEGQQPE